MEQKPRKISNFHLTRSLYSGSKTEVHQGRFAQAGGVVQLAAVKVLRPHFAMVGDELRSFLAEAGWATELRSPLFPRVFEAGEHKGHYFIAMEYVGGWTLAKVLGSLATLQVPLPCEIGLAIAGQLTNGLHKMHERMEHDQLMGIVHLGINPENIMLSKEGQTKLLDFGMTIAAVDREVTEPDEGDVEFQSPERRRGLPVDRRADVYSLGQVLKHMVSCMVPDVVGSDLPALLTRACHEDPDQRFASMKDFNVALKLVAQNRGLSPTRAACEKFTLEIFGHKVAKSDPRAKRPAPVVPLMMSSEGQKTSYEPVTPPPGAIPGLTTASGLSDDSDKTAVGADTNDVVTAAPANPDALATPVEQGADVMATAIGGGAHVMATAVGGGADAMAAAVGDDAHVMATAIGGGADVMATVPGDLADSVVTAVGEASHLDPAHMEATTKGEVELEKPTVVGAKPSMTGESMDGMMTVPGGPPVEGTSTAVGAAPEAPRFVDEHLAVTSAGGPPAPPAPPEGAGHEDVTAFSVAAPEDTVDTPKKPAKGGFREELIPTKPYSAHKLDDEDT